MFKLTARDNYTIFPMPKQKTARVQNPDANETVAISDGRANGSRGS